MTRNILKNLDHGFYSDREVGELFLKRYVLINLDSNFEKVKFLSLMVKKLTLLNDEKISPDNLDSLTM